MNTSRNRVSNISPLLSRRSLLRGGLAATATIPLLDASRLVGQTENGGAPPTRLVAIATPNGTRNDLFWPSGSAGSLTFPQLTAPLSPIQDKLLFLKGIRHCPAVVGDNGFNGAMNGSEHARGQGGFLTARPLGTGTFRSFMATSGWGSGISLDQHLAAVLNPPTTFKTLELGVHVRDAEVRGRISYTGPDQPVPPREDPADVFQALFGNMPSMDSPMPTTDGGEPALAQLRAERRSVFDLSLREIQRLQARLGQEDRSKLEAHLAAIRNIEERLGSAEANDRGSSAPGCAPPSGNFAVDIGNDASLPETTQLQFDLAAAALACDQTRIVTIQFQFAESEHLFPFLGLNRNHHVISHDWQGTTGFTEYGEIHVWLAEQVLYFLQKLDGYQEGERTLLDDSVVFWGSEIGESTSHDLTLMPYMLAGSAGGKLQAKGIIDYGQTRQDNNKLLITLAQAMGAQEVTEFGDPSGESDTLPDVLA